MNTIKDSNYELAWEILSDIIGLCFLRIRAARVAGHALAVHRLKREFVSLCKWREMLEASGPREWQWVINEAEPVVRAKMAE